MVGANTVGRRVVSAKVGRFLTHRKTVLEPDGAFRMSVTANLPTPAIKYGMIASSAPNGSNSFAL